MTRPVNSFWRRAFPGLTIALLSTSLLGLSTPNSTAQEAQTFTLYGQSAYVLQVGGADYVREDRLEGVFKIGRVDSPRWGRLISLEQQGVTLLLPIDANAQYASEVNYGVQIGGRRIPGRAATFLRNSVYLPLSTIAEAFGAEYTPGVGGSFTQPAPRLTSVASESKPGERYDRVVLELNRPMPYTSSFKQGKLTLELPGVVGAAANYTTRGAYAKLVTVENVEAKKLLKVSLELPAGVGYRIYPVSSNLGGRSRIVLDVGASLSRSESVLAIRKRRPVIVLDPGHGGADTGVKGPRPEKTLTLEVAQQVGKLLTARGWQVLFTRTSDQKVSNTSRAAMARRSDLFLSFHLAAFPGAGRSGVSLYRFDGESGLALSDRLRLGGLTGDLRFVGAVSPLTRSQSFSSALSGSLVAGGFKVWQERAPRALILQDAPQVGLQLELGWPQNSQDALWLRDVTKLKKFSSIVAASIATFLTPKDGS